MIRNQKAAISVKFRAWKSRWFLCVESFHNNLADDMECKDLRAHDVDDDDDPASCLENSAMTRQTKLKWEEKFQPLPQKVNWKMLSVSEALSLLEDTGKLPSYDNFLFILLKCKREKNLACLKRMYRLISNNKDACEALGNYFVPAFVDCGSILCARYIFDRLHYCNEFSWTSLIQAHIDHGETQQAFDMFSKMEGEPADPNKFTYVALLRGCAQKKCFEKGQELHLEIVKEGYEGDQYVGSILIDLYAKCGALDEAQEVFDELAVRDTVLWTTVIAAYTEHGLAEEALRSFQQMQLDDVPLDAGTYVCILKACSSLEDLVRGQEIHCEVMIHGLEGDSFVGNTLVNFYAKCGQLVEARDVFDKLPLQDVVAWNALVAGYSENKMGEEVLYCLQQMQREGRPSNAVTLSCSLKACGSLQAIDRGQGIHSDIIKKGFDGEGIVGNTLVDMYVKCSLLAEALLVFDNLSVRDLISWNTIFAAYAEYGLGEAACNFLEQMKLQGVSPNYITFICSLKACGSEGAIDGGLNLHTEITMQGLERDTVVGNTLVDMYAKCGWLKDSQDSFEELAVHDVVSWNVLIAGYAERKLGEEVLHCLKRMHFEDVSPDALTYVFVLKSCGDSGALQKCQEVHAEIASDGLELDFHVSSSLVVLYSKCGALLEAREGFDTMSQRDVVSWTALISGYVEHGLGKEALDLLQKMCLDGVSPNAFTYVSSLKACSKLGNICRGQELHSEITGKGYERDSFLCSSLVDMYSKCGFLEEAHGLLEQLPARDVVAWTALISGYADHGFCKEALACFEQMQHEGLSPDAVLWNAMILAHADQGDYEQAFELYAQLQEQGLLPDSVIFVSILKACGDPAALEMGKKVHVKVHRPKPEAREVIVMNALVDMYGRCGSMIDAQRVFDIMPSWDLASWNTLTTGYARQGESELVFHLFQRMRESGIQPDGVTFLNLLTACSHAGLLNEGRDYFEAMIQVYGISPTIKHQNCLIDLFSRAGQLDEAVLTVDKMPFEPDFVVWSTMLSACRKWGDVELGKHFFSGALKSDDNKAGAFVMMFNIYSDAGMWEDAMKIHTMRTKKGDWCGTWKSWNETSELEPLWWELEGIT